MSDFLRKLLICNLLALLMAGCAPGGNETPTDEAANPIPVGVYAALTGPTASFGVATRDGATLAADEINKAGGVLGRPIRLIIEDDQGRPEEAASVVTKLITRDRVVAVIGENASSRSLAAAPICQANRVPMISPSSTNPQVTQKGDFIFRMCFIDPYQGDVVAAFSRNNLKLDRVSVLQDVKNDYSVGLAKFFTESFQRRGGRVLGTHSYAEGDNDFRSQLTAIKRAGPQAIFIPGYYTDAGQIAIQARDLGIKAPLLGGDGWDSPKLLEIGGDALNGSYFANHYFAGDPRPTVQNFVAGFKSRYGHDPDGPAVLGYDAVKLLADAIQRTGSADPVKIRDAIATTKDFEGVSGTISFGPDRNPIKPVALIAIRDGAWHFEGWVRP
jgi:branched-chain amino acid transport system substrate-binding protein